MDDSILAPCPIHIGASTCGSKLLTCFKSFRKLTTQRIGVLVYAHDSSNCVESVLGFLFMYLIKYCTMTASADFLDVRKIGVASDTTPATWRSTASFRANRPPIECPITTTFCISPQARRNSPAHAHTNPSIRFVSYLLVTFHVREASPPGWCSPHPAVHTQSDEIRTAIPWTRESLICLLSASYHCLSRKRLRRFVNFALDGKHLLPIGPFKMKNSRSRFPLLLSFYVC